MLYNRISGLVSVVITNYNHVEYIVDCLNSIKNQTYKNIEIIIVDDASTDNSVQVINNWIDTNKHCLPKQNLITLTSLSRNSGFAAAVSLGFSLSKGQFIACQDSDDISHPKRIEKQVAFIKENPDVHVIGSNYSTFEDNCFNLTPPLNWLSYGATNIKEIYSKGGHCVCYGTILFYGELFDKFGGLTRRLPGAEDYEFITKLLSTGIDNLPDVLYYYRHHSQQRSHKFYSNKSEKTDIEPIKVLLTMDSMGIGGTETHVLTLATELIRAKINVVILANKGVLYDAFNKIGCTIYTMEFPLTIISSQDINASIYKNRIEQIIRNENINIIHAHQSPSGALCIDVAKKLNIPCVFTVHGLYYQDIASDKLNNCTKVISVSEPVFDWLHTFNIPSIVIPNGIDFNSFHPIKANNIRNQLHVPDDAFVILYASRMAWGKINVCENVIRVSSDLRNNKKMNIHVFIVGDGPGFKDIKDAADKITSPSNKKFIHLFGEQTDMLDFYSNSDCIVGTGRVALESMACGKPLIATGNQGYFGLVTRDNFREACRIYFADHKAIKPNNQEFLYDDLSYIYNNKQVIKKIGETSTEWSRPIFDISITTNKIIKLYKSAINDF
ncbi:glycosyltransferase [Clostridium akagii]|uniref:glycosyltransferase n=1 Tax=Clostridium akagii TaxID=91623 RepID=UPI000478C6DA|nr:glycosyltransferase [Clostridium akagii]